MSSTIRENVERIRERIAGAASRSGREPEEVRLVAVTKTVAPERVAEAVQAGVDVLGENYVQETEEKRESIPGSAQWHLIGHLQSNKARLAVRLFDVCETVDRPKIIRALEQHAAREEKRLGLLIQVNLFGEDSKSGAPPDQVLSLIEQAAACEHLRCTGLMTVPPFYDEPERARPAFVALRRLRDEVQRHCPSCVKLEELSMGMSGDFEVAIEEGATLVRIGTAIFGSRRR